jgi:hypothetical protein
MEMVAKMQKENPGMRTVSTVARYLAGVIFLVFGLNGFLNFIPLPPPGGLAGQFMGALYASHYLWVIFAFQVIAAVLLLVTVAVAGASLKRGDTERQPPVSKEYRAQEIMRIHDK